MRDSVMLYRNQIDALRHLTPEQFKDALLGICDYELDDIVPEGDPLTVAMFMMAKPLIDKRNRNYENGLRGGRPKNRNETEPKPNHNRTITELEPTDNRNEPTDNLKDKGERLKEKGERRKVKQFIPPTREELKEYVLERGVNIDIDRFLDYYQANGWMVGKNKMKDWKATVRNWSRSQRQEKTAERVKKPTTQRDIDFHALELALFERDLKGQEDYEKYSHQDDLHREGTRDMQL